MARGGGTVSGGGEPGAPRWLPRVPVDSPTTGGGSLEEGDLPATTRIGRAGGPDRALRVSAVLVVAVIGLALVKPWDWGRPTSSTSSVSPAPSAAAPDGPTTTPSGAATPGRRSWTDLTAAISCVSDELWTAVLDEVGDDGRAITRSWTRLDLAPARGPADPAIVRVSAYAGAVPRIGFCAPALATGRWAAADRLVVDTWRLDEDARAGAPVPVPIEPPVVSGGMIADGGVFYGPPAAPLVALSPGGAGDPEVTWSADGTAHRRPAGWSAGLASPAFAGWPPGTYVFRVLLAGAGPDGSDAAWFAINLRGPWIGPAASRAPGADGVGTPSGPSPPAATPDTEPPGRTPAPAP